MYKTRKTYTVAMDKVGNFPASTSLIYPLRLSVFSPIKTIIAVKNIKPNIIILLILLGILSNLIINKVYQICDSTGNRPTVTNSLVRTSCSKLISTAGRGSLSLRRKLLVTCSAVRSPTRAKQFARLESQLFRCAPNL